MWEVSFHSVFEAWLKSLDLGDQKAILAAIRILATDGPSLGSPLVKSIKASRYSNMKELRPGSTGRSEVRVLFAFDLNRSAILLLGGDKSGQWKQWYKTNIPIADDLFDGHQATIRKAQEELKNEQEQTGRGKRK
jgi:hypothetical protein